MPLPRRGPRIRRAARRAGRKWHRRRLGGDVGAGRLREVPFLGGLVPVGADESGLEKGAAEGVAAVDVGVLAGEVLGGCGDEGGVEGEV